MDMKYTMNQYTGLALLALALYRVNMFALRQHPVLDGADARSA